MISVTILTKNSSRHLKEVLDALDSFEEILIYDNGSTDDTLQIANCYPNCRIEKGPFLGFGPTHNHASSLAKYDWILSIDSDEVVSKELVEEIFSLKLEDKIVYSIPRKNEFNGKWIYSCGWSPDRVNRLYNRKKTRFTDALVHETVAVEGMKKQLLQSSIKHYSYEDLSDFLSKMQSYSTLFASQRAGKATSSPFKAVIRGLFSFFRSYIIKKGIFQGYEGFVISVYNGQTAFWKYLKLYEANQRKK